MGKLALSKQIRRMLMNVMLKVTIWWEKRTTKHQLPVSIPLAHHGRTSTPDQILKIRAQLLLGRFDLSKLVNSYISVPKSTYKLKTHWLRKWNKCSKAMMTYLLGVILTCWALTPTSYATSLLFSLKQNPLLRENINLGKKGENIGGKKW